MPEAPPPVEIAVFVGSWLPYSETFVYDQLRFQRRTHAHVFARGRTPHASAFPYAPCTVLGPAARLGYLAGGIAPSLDRALAQSGARLAFAHFGVNGAYALPFVRRAGIPLAVMFHGHDVGGLMPQNRWTIRYARYQWLRDALFDYASLLFCASTELAEQLERLGAPVDKLRVHRLGIDLERFTPGTPDDKSPAPHVLMIGRLVEKKGMVYGIRAFARLRATLPDAKLDIIGTGPLREALAREVTDAGLDAHVRFLGALSHADVGALMHRAHLVMTPSVTTASGDRESGVIVLKEAAATGLPTIGTRHGGIPEIIEHERTRLLVEERDEAQLADALARILSRPDLQRAMGEAARAKMEREYDQRRQVAALEAALLEVVGAGTSSAAP